MDRVVESAANGGGLEVAREQSDVHCARCGYWLLHSDQHGVCPECELAVRASVLFATDPRCIRQRRRVGVAGLLLCLSLGLLALFPVGMDYGTQLFLESLSSPEPSFSFLRLLQEVCLLPGLSALGAALWLCGLPGMVNVADFRERMWRFAAWAGLVWLVGDISVTFLSHVVYWGRMANQPLALSLLPLHVTVVCSVIVALWIWRAATYYPVRWVRWWVTAGIIAFVACFVMYKVTPRMMPAVAIDWTLMRKFLLLVLVGPLVLFVTVLAAATVLIWRSSRELDRVRDAGAAESAETFDVRCAGCGYSLRYADEEGKCPECGLDVRASVLFATDPACVRQRRRVGVAGMFLGLSYLLLVIGGSAQTSRRVGEPEYSYYMLLAFCYWLPACGALWMGLQLCSRPGLACVLGHRERIGRGLARAGLWGLGVGLAGWAGGIAMYWGRMRSIPWIFGSPLFVFIIVGMLIVALWVRNVLRFYPMQRVRGWVTIGIAAYVVSVVVHAVTPFLWTRLSLAVVPWDRIVLVFALGGHVVLFLTVLVGSWVVFRRSGGKWVGRRALQGKDA